MRDSTAESRAITLETPEEEHKTPINNNNIIIQTAIICAWTKGGERVGGIEICGCNVKCRQLISYFQNIPEIIAI